MISGVDGRMVFVNRLAEDLLGYRRRELIGQPVELLLPEAERVAHAARRDRFVVDGSRRPMGGGLVLAARRKDGSLLPVEIGLGPVESDGEVLVIATLRDVSARLATEAALAKAEEERRNLLERLINVAEEERQRIAADIHDDSVQVLAALALRLEWVAGRIDDPELTHQVEEIGETARASLARLRHLTFELYPPSLEDDGLAAVLRLHVDELRSRSGVDFTLDVEVSREPDTQTGIIVYRIVQEALTNVVKHADARRVRIDLSATEAGVTAHVSDDGVGMASDRASRPEPGHLGLRAMRERAEMAGGWWRIESALGTGTRIEFFVPAG